MTNSANDLLSALDPSVRSSILQNAVVRTDVALTLQERWHLIIQSPVIGFVHKEFLTLDALAAEVSNVTPHLKAGYIKIIRGCDYPIYCDGTGDNLFVVDETRREIPLSNTINQRVPVTFFGITPQQVNLDELDL